MRPAAMVLLCLSLLALALGPAIAGVLRKHRLFALWIDSLVVVGMLGLTLLHILPHTVASLGLWAVPAWIVGMALPNLLHGASDPCGHRQPRAFVALVALALGLHAVLDGVALVPERDASYSLGLAVLLHRLLEGLGVWWLTGGTSTGLRFAALMGLGAATVLGYVTGAEALSAGLGQTVNFVQAMVAGSLLHVLARHPTTAVPQAGDKVGRWVSSLGGVTAVLAISWLDIHAPPHNHSHHHASLSAGCSHELAALPKHVSPMDIVAQLIGHAGWPLILAFILVALQHSLAAASASRPAKRQGRRFGPVGEATFGALRGLALATCSCGVVPLFRQRLLRGASMAEAVAFLLAAPAVGPIGLMLSLALLGTGVTLLRILMAWIVACMAASFIGTKTTPTDARPTERNITNEQVSARPGLWPTFADGIGYALGDVLNFTAPWLMSGVILSVLAYQLIQPRWLQLLHATHLDIVALALLAAPLYVCAGAGTLIAAVLAAKGASVGATLAFLGASASLSWVSLVELRAHASRTRCWAAGAAMTLAIVVVATLVDWLVPTDFSAVDLAQKLTIRQQMGGAVATAAVVWATTRQGVRGALEQVAGPNRHDTHGAHHDHA